MSTDTGRAPSWSAESPEAPTPARHPALASRVITGAPLPATRPRYRQRAVITVVSFLGAGALFAGGAIWGRATTSGSTVSVPSPTAIRVAAAWVDATGADLERTGALRAAVEPVGWQDHGSTHDTWFVVVPTGKPAFGLTVRQVNGSLVAIPSISPLPFGGGALPPLARTGNASTGGGSLRQATPPVVTRWVQQTFGSHSALAISPGIALVGAPEILARWSAGPGGTVVQLRVPLGSSAPGTPAAAARRRVAHDRAVVIADQAALSTEVHAVGSATATDASDNASLNSAEAASTAAAAASATANAAASAPPGGTLPGSAPTPASTAATAAAAASAAAAAAVGPAQTAATAAAQALAADQAKEGQDRQQLRRDQAAVASATARVPPRFSAVGTYDVWVQGTSVKGWVPVGYRGD